MKLKRKLAALAAAVMMAVSTLSMSASAALEYDNWPAFYTPYTGSFYATTMCLYVSNLKWTPTQISQMKFSYPNSYSTTLELEFRPLKSDGTSLDPDTIWSAIDRDHFSTNIPGAYGEFQAWDPDDVAICIKNVADLQPEHSYYAYMGMKAQNNAPTGVPYIFETELGTWIPEINDSGPWRYSQYLDRQVTTKFPYTYSW